MIFYLLSLLLISQLVISSTAALNISNTTINEVIDRISEKLNDTNLSNISKKFVVKDPNETLNKTINSSVKIINGPIINLTNISINNQTIGDIVDNVTDALNNSINITVKKENRSFQERIREVKLVKKINEEKPELRYKIERLAQRFPALQQLIY